MKISDVVKQIQLLLPKNTDLVSRSLSISSVAATTSLVTIATSESHLMKTGAGVTISDVAFLNSITTVSQDGLVFTFETNVDHDLTQGWPEHEQVTFSGFTDSSWNDSFDLVGVPNRTAFRVRSSNTLPTLNTNEVLHEIRDDGVNGRYAVSKTGNNSFTISGTFLDGDYEGGSIVSGVRVAGAVTAERALEQYTKQNTDEVWAYVIASDPEVSKDRTSYSDATASKSNGVDMRTRLIDGFSVLFVIRASKDISGVSAIDICRHDLQLPILKSVYGARFDTGVSGDPDFRSVLRGHGLFDYNRAVLSYIYSFEFAYELTNDDVVNEGDTRAFRDVDYTLQGDINNDDAPDMTVGVILQDEEA